MATRTWESIIEQAGKWESLINWIKKSADCEDEEMGIIWDKLEDLGIDATGKAIGEDPRATYREFLEDTEDEKEEIIYECDKCGKKTLETGFVDDVRDVCLECVEKEKEKMVCCVGCNEPVCRFEDEPPHKDQRDEAVCDDCWAEKEDECVNCDRCYKKIPFETEITVKTKRNTFFYCDGCQEEEEDEDKCVVCGRKGELRDYHMPSTIIERVCVNLPCGQALSMDLTKLRIEAGT